MNTGFHFVRRVSTVHTESRARSVGSGGARRASRRPLVALAALVLLCAGITAASASTDSAPPVTLQDEGSQVVLSNGLVSFTAHKADATISRLTLGDSPNLTNRGAYLAVRNSVGRDAWDLHQAEFKVERCTPDLVEVSFAGRIGGIRFTPHYILRRGDPGFYVFVLQERRAGDPAETTGHARWSFYLQDALFDYQWASDAEHGPVPDMEGAQQIQDATFRLRDGSVYTKYDLCTYVEEDLVHGLCGRGKGSYGAFIITPSQEWHQAPTKQYITVHARTIMHQMLQTGHFIPREVANQSVPDGWIKLCGPWFVYLNRGDSPKAIWADAKARAEDEKQRWPYAWMAHPAFPLQRGRLSGRLVVQDDRHPAANALVVLTAPQPEWQVQVLNYIFSTRTDAEGRFVLPHVRPGTYTLFASVPGLTDEFRRDAITVGAGGVVDLGSLVFSPRVYSTKLWEIGAADRRTTGFRLSDQPRQYGLAASLPAELTYTIGQSDPARDWYYAQAKEGDWTIRFDLDRAYQGDAVFTLGIAGQTSNPTLQILANGSPVGTYSGGNSSALYRSAVLGSSYYETKVVRFPTTKLRVGANTVALRLIGGSVMYDVIKLEIDEPATPARAVRVQP